MLRGRGSISPGMGPAADPAISEVDRRQSASLAIIPSGVTEYWLLCLSRGGSTDIRGSPPCAQLSTVQRCAQALWPGAYQSARAVWVAVFAGRRCGNGHHYLPDGYTCRPFLSLPVQISTDYISILLATQHHLEST